MHIILICLLDIVSTRSRELEGQVCGCVQIWLQECARQNDVQTEGQQCYNGKHRRESRERHLCKDDDKAPAKTDLTKMHCH